LGCCVLVFIEFSAVNDRITSLAERAPAGWNARFKASIEQFYSSREQVVRYGTPSLEEYMLLRRQMYGGSIALDLAELLEMYTIPEVQKHTQELLADIRRAALDVIAWSTVKLITPISPRSTDLPLALALGRRGIPVSPLSIRKQIQPDHAPYVP
jgi:hypothetical protein